MFERFTQKARDLMGRAREVAIDRADGYIGTEHLLLAMAVPQTGLASQVLGHAGILPAKVGEQLAQRAVRPALVTDEDIVVLKALGIDATAILDGARSPSDATSAPPSAARTGESAEEQPPAIRSGLAGAVQRMRGAEMRPKAIPFTPAAKKVLELSLREALQLTDNYIGTEHLLLGLLRQQGLACEVLTELGADLEGLRREAIAARPVRDG